MKLFFPFIGMALICGCSNSNSLQETSWRKGDDIRDLQFLNEIDMPLPQSIAVLNEKIEFSPQVYAGIPIENTFIKKINAKNGQLLSVSSMHKSDFYKFPHPDLNAFKITAKIENDLLKKFALASKKDLINLTPLLELSGRTVWSVSYFDKSGMPYAVKLDKNLMILSKTPVGASLFDSAAMIFPAGPKFSQLKEILLKNVSFRPQLSNPQYIISSPQTGPIAETDRVLNFNTQDPRFDQVQVYYYVAQVIDWIHSSLGIDFQMPLDIQLHVGYPEKTNAAFYYQGKIRLGAGDDVVYSKMPQDPSIVSHEVFHGLIDMLAKLPFEGEGGSLNEAFADFFTAQMLGRPHLGESSYLAGPYKRSVENNKKWSEKTGALYGDSLIISGLLWDLSENISAVKIRNVALKTLTHLNPASRLIDFNQECREALREYLSEEEFNRAQIILARREFPK